MQFLEGQPADIYKLLIKIVMKILTCDRLTALPDDRYSFASVILRAAEGQDMPDEDEGIPGHRPGNAISSTDPNIGNNLANLRLGKLAMDKELEDEIRAEVNDIDISMPPAPEQSSAT